MRLFSLTYRLFLVVALTSIIALASFELEQRDRNRIYPVAEMPLERAGTMLEQERWAEAQLLARFVKDHPEAGDVALARGIAGRAHAGKAAEGGDIEKFVQGALSGEPEDIPSLLGSLSLDLFVVGDIRDLAVQGYKEVKHGEGDKLILGLSAVGLATTLTPALDWAPAVMKGFRRGGAMTPGFTKALQRTSGDALKTRRLGALTDVVADFGKATKKLGPGPMKTAMKSVEGERSLKKVANAATIDPAATYTVATLMGSKGVRLIKLDGKNIGKLAGQIKVSSRFVKSLRKTTAVVPDEWLKGGMYGAALLLTMLLLRWLRRMPLLRRIAT